MSTLSPSASASATEAFFPTRTLLDPEWVPDASSLSVARTLHKGRPPKVRIGENRSGECVPSEWLLGALSTIFALKRLPANWDGHGSPSLQDNALHIAIRLLLEIRQERLLRPAIGPVAGGGVQMEWHIGNRELELEVLPDGSAEYLKVEGNQMEEGSFKPNDGKALELIRWLAYTQSEL